MQLRRLSAIVSLCLLPLLVGGCSGYIGDGIEELNYDKNNTSTTGSPDTGNQGQTGGTATPVTTSGNGAYMTIERFDVAPASIGLGQTATVSWGLKFKTPAVAYTAEFHLSSSQQLTPGLSGLTRIFADNGSIDTTQLNTDTSLTATNACTRQTDLAGTPLLNCGSRGATNLTLNLTQPVYGILKACVYDLNNQLVCAEKPLPLTFP